MTKPTFRIGRDRPTNVYVVVDPANPEDDPQIGYIAEGWAKVLVDQANDAVAPREWATGTTTVEFLIPGGKMRQYEALLQAARQVLSEADFEINDVTDELRGCIELLRAAVQPFVPYNQDTET